MIFSFYAADIPHLAVVVYLYLKERANKNSTRYPAIGTIAKDLKLSRRTIQRAITDLEKTGHLQKEHRWRGKRRQEQSTVYGEMKKYISCRQRSSVCCRRHMVCIIIAYAVNLSL